MHLGIDDGGDQVAAKGRPDLVQQVLVRLPAALKIANPQVGAVGGQAGPNSAGDARRQVAPDGRRAEEQDIGLPLPHQFGGYLGKGQRAVYCQLGMFGQEHLVRAILDNLSGQIGNLVAQQ